MGIGETRRENIIQILKQRDEPVVGTELARLLGVSRQVIVQDIALLRVSTDYRILATNKGYIIFEKEKDSVQRIIPVSHEEDDIEDELLTIINNGGKIHNVILEHDIYGDITVDLIIESKSDLEDFLYKLNVTKAKPLSLLSNGAHFHTVSAISEEVLDNIERALKKKGYTQ